MPRMNATPTAAQQAASRANGAMGGRPRKDDCAAAQRRAREEARDMGVAAIVGAIDYLVWTMNDTTVAPSERTRCAVELLERYGHPRQSAVISASLDVEDVKTLELVGFAPPAGWNGPKEPAQPPGEAAPSDEETVQ